MDLSRVLMCPPTYFAIDYSINPWMDVGNKVDRGRAMAQWTEVKERLVGHGVQVDVIEPESELPDMTFTGDAGVVHRGKYLASRFRHPERAGEIAPFRRWLAEHRFESFEVPPGVSFEGLGDIIYFEDQILFASGQRSSANAAAHIARVFPELRIRLELELVDPWFYHAGLCLAQLSRDTVMYYAPAFSAASQAALAREFSDLIAVSEVDAKKHMACCNILAKSEVILDGCSPELTRALEARGLTVHPISMSEFKKSGGSVRCLILNL